MKTLSLRVFRRTKDNISFLFNPDALVDFDIKNLKIFNIADPKIPLTYLHMINTGMNTVQVVIDHTLNNLKTNKIYLFNFIFSDTVSAKIKVYPTEVLPIAEKDDKKQNVHMFGWCDEENKWVKIKAVKTKDGSYALATKVVE